MKHYIDKSALVAELNRLIAELVEEGEDTMFEQGRISAFEDVKVFINHTLEVKEIGVDLGDPQGDIGVKWVQEEAVSNDLEAEFVLYLKHKFNIPQEGNTLKTDGWRLSPYDLLDIAKHFAQWQKGQMVKNRIEHCDNITEEQYNLETGFLDDFLDKNKRMPTFLDAIEYGMKKAMEE